MIIKIRAKIRLYEEGRKTPFRNGYRPLFNFIEEVRISGQIQLLDRDEFFPGDEAEVEISFLYRKYLIDNFYTGARFIFGESPVALGEGEILDIMSDNIYVN